MTHSLRSALPALAILVLVLAAGPVSIGIGVAGADEPGVGGYVALDSSVCLGDTTPVGVLTTTPADHGLLVTGNVTVAGADPTVIVRDHGNGEYGVVVTTGVPENADDCRPATTITRRLPADASGVSVVVDGQTVGSVDGTGAVSLS
ncbi:hypothetical protein [Halomicrobium katesii]|uniref:hypothetical protein n=1 Tax=Halomicrobium katesii TaxID=437163 RepID=UPI0012BA8F80|nr:hypothetical protein [Halomicrobium katesii]